MSATSTFEGKGIPQIMLRCIQLLSKYTFELIVIAFILYICISRGLKVGMTIHDPEMPTTEHSVLSFSAMLPLELPNLLSFFEQDADLVQTAAILPLTNVSQLVPQPTTVASHTPENGTTAISIQAPAAAGYDDFNSVAQTNDPAPHISNLTLVLSPDYARRKNLAPTVVSAKKQRVQNYLRRYAGVAQQEMRQYGIPASITLAQALLESNAGDSKLAVQSNNHFGIKCRSRCLGCTCRNYGDDTRYDMFRVFESVAASFREHSELLTSSRYARLANYGTDYKKWAHGLKACGYATDKRYAYKLIKIIEELELDRFDETYAA